MKKKSVSTTIFGIVLGGAVIGAIFVGIYIYILLNATGDPEALKKAALSTLLMGVLFLIPVYMIKVMIDKLIVDKIRLIEKALEEVSMGNLDHKVHIEGNDELSDLAESFERMRISLKTIMDKLEKGEL